jgi:hypothetical protein
MTSGVGSMACLWQIQRGCHGGPFVAFLENFSRSFFERLISANALFFNRKQIIFCV